MIISFITYLWGANITRHWWVWIVYGVIFIIVGAGHIVWFATTHDPAIGARFGSTLISLGIIVTAQVHGYGDLPLRWMGYGAL
jgi:hypothetical protein